MTETVRDILFGIFYDMDEPQSDDTFDRAAKEVTKAVLDDMREWNGKRTAPGCPASRYAYFAADINAYEKDRE